MGEEGNWPEQEPPRAVDLEQAPRWGQRGPIERLSS